MAGTKKYEPWEDTDMVVPRDEGNDLDDLVVTVEPLAKTDCVGEGDCFQLIQLVPFHHVPSLLLKVLLSHLLVWSLL